MPDLGLLVLRLALAAVLVAHGAHVLFGFLPGPGIGSGGLADTAARYAQWHLQPAYVLAIVAGLTQLVGGVLIAVGWFTRWAAAAALIYIGVGIWVEHRKWGMFLNWVMAPGQGHGLEYSILFAGALMCLILAGAGDASIDGRRSLHRASRAAGRERLRRRS